MRDAVRKVVAPLTAEELQALPKDGPKAWATKILMRQSAGEKTSPTALAMAKRGLGLPDGT